MGIHSHTHTTHNTQHARTHAPNKHTTHTHTLNIRTHLALVAEVGRQIEFGILMQLLHRSHTIHRIRHGTETALRGDSSRSRDLRRLQNQSNCLHRCGAHMRELRGTRLLLLHCCFTAALLLLYCKIRSDCLQSCGAHMRELRGRRLLLHMCLIIQRRTNICVTCLFICVT